MEELSVWEALLLAAGLGIQPVGAEPPSSALKQHLLRPAREAFVLQSQAQLRQFRWDAQAADLQDALKQRQAQVALPKYQFTSVQVQAVDVVGPGMTNHLSLSFQTEKMPQQSAWLIKGQTQLSLFGKEIQGHGETVWYPSLGGVQGWNDSTIDSERWRFKQVSQWIFPLPDGSLPRHFTVQTQTENRSLTALARAKIDTNDLQCQSSEPYLGRQVHANIKGKVQQVTCQRLLNGEPIFETDVLYLMDYQYHLPTGDYFAGRRWQWQVTEFTGT
ncbi:hypothetical protein [Vitreoscilla stercoraria]|uniref:Uncharacterized protein n=1 Tax=Vitreoscilla stercoraria TaxID=61 RepID=A0ABY4E9L1_VITST|nr:hypothetical protein [Vitreoscilla stercoraria]UOO92132.1 hypothetical protein LVJ81_10980 [Vitreoscilla stercoraria]